MNKVVVKCRAKRTHLGTSGEASVELEYAVMLAPIGSLLTLDGAPFVPQEQAQDAMLRCQQGSAEQWVKLFGSAVPADVVDKVRSGDLVVVLPPGSGNVGAIVGTLEPRDHVLGEFREVLVMRDGRIVLDDSSAAPPRG